MHLCHKMLDASPVVVLHCIIDISMVCVCVSSLVDFYRAMVAFAKDSEKGFKDCFSVFDASSYLWMSSRGVCSIWLNHVRIILVRSVILLFLSDSVQHRISWAHWNEQLNVTGPLTGRVIGSLGKISPVSHGTKTYSWYISLFRSGPLFLLVSLDAWI